MADSSNSSSCSSSADEVSWISKFCNEKGHEFFCEVDKVFIADPFNLVDFKNEVQYFDNAVNLLLDRPNTKKRHYKNQKEMENTKTIIGLSARTLYGLIHSRFILSISGLEKMKEKYVRGDFGCCPRVFCDQQNVLPIGLADKFGSNKVKLFCPKCEDLYNPVSNYHANIDGAFFGTSFPHLLFMTYPEKRPLEPKKTYIPKLFGFKIHPTAYKD